MSSMTPSFIMKVSTLLLTALTAISTSVGAAAVMTADSRITAVTVYPDRAVVTRSAKINPNATGGFEVVFEKLPAGLLDESLQVSGHGAAENTILDVTARPVFVDFTPNERVKAIEDEIKTLSRKERALTDRSAILTQQHDYVLKIQSATTTPTKDGPSAASGSDTWLKLLTFTEDQLGKIASELQSLESEREDIQLKRAALEQQLNQLRGGGGRSYKSVVVRMEASAVAEIELTIRYAVLNASWSPSYDARVLSNAHSVQLGYFAMVRQNTGEDWKNIELTLSTARPSLGGAAPDLQPWIIAKQEPALPSPQASEDVLQLSPFEVSAKRDEGYRTSKSVAGARVRTELRDIASAATVLAQQATSATFRVPITTDVMSDNTARKVPVTTLNFRSVHIYRAAPKLVPGAFLSANVLNTSEFPLLAGSMNVFLDDTFVAASSLRTVMPGEKFDLALGADEGISVKRKLNNRFTEDTGLVNKGKRITYDVTFTLQNNKKTAEKITLLDQIPVSRHEKIVVKLLTPDEKVAKPDAEGILKWNVELNAGEKRDLPLRFTVEYPNDLPVVGME
jgi:uncharacterized protein (TIGR02231 family)